jgi:hypothetical protein
MLLLSDQLSCIYTFGCAQILEGLQEECTGVRHVLLQFVCHLDLGCIQLDVLRMLENEGLIYGTVY